MNSLLDVDQLRTFLAIVETGSFTRAAEIVHKTQSAVSMQMKRLEERLERPIFARDGRAPELTEGGRRRSNASSAWAGPTACCTRVGTPARSRPLCSPGSRSRYFRNPACGRACACSARPTVLRNCPPAGSDCCAIRTSNRRSPRRLPNTSSPRSTIYPQRPTRRSRQGSEISNQKGATLDSLHFLSLPGRNSHKSTDSSPRMSASGLKPDGLPLSRKVAEVPTAVMKGTQHPADFRSP